MRLLVFALVLTTVSALAKRQPPVACTPGAFPVAAGDQPKLATLVGSPVGAFTLGAGGAVTLGPCTATAKMTAKRRVTVVTVRMPACGTATNAKLVVKIPAPSCTTVKGTLHARKRHTVHFAATRTTTTTTLPGGAAVCGDGERNGSEVCEGLDGCGALERCTSACTCEPVPPRPAVSQQLIAAALARGEITYPQSLVYRAWALFADSRLPPAYDGQAWQYEDNGLFREARRVWDSLDAPTQADLMPFLLRPNEPGSYYSPAVPAPGLAAPRATRGPRAAEPPSVECPYQPGADARDWRAKETTHFVIWSCGGGDPALDPYAAKRDIVAGVAEQVWAAMTPDTVEPPGDNWMVGPDLTTRFDVYLLEPRRCKTREGGCVPVPVGVGTDGQPLPAQAAVASTPPCGTGPLGAEASASFAVVDVDQVTPAPAGNGPWLFRYVFAHEFFHAIENALNLDAQGGGCRGDGTPNDTVTSWLVEASAEWAAWAYFPADGPDERAAWFRGFQTRDATTESLRWLDEQRVYEAFLYPFFVQQETGGNRSAFLDVWKKSGGARNAEQLDDVLNGVLPFADHFRDFAVRNFDTTLPGSPVQPTYQAVGGGNIPPGVQPVVIQPTVALDVPPGQKHRPALMQELTAQYERFTVAKGLRYVKIDLQTLVNSAFVQADLLANVKGTWTRRKAPGLVVEFCRDDPGDDIQEFYLVLSHHDRRPNVHVSGSYTVETRTTCPVGWSGSLTYVLHIDDVLSDITQAETRTKDDHSEQRETWTLVHTTPGMPPDSLDTIDAVWTGSASRSDLETYHHNPDPNVCLGERFYYHFTATASGTGSQRFQVSPNDQDPDQVLLIAVDQLNAGTGTASTDEFICPDTHRTFPSPYEVTENPGLTEDFYIPNPNDPDHYTGTKTLNHTDVPQAGGHQLYDDRVEWDFRRRRQPAPQRGSVR